MAVVEYIAYKIREYITYINNNKNIFVIKMYSMNKRKNYYNDIAQNDEKQKNNSKYSFNNKKIKYFQFYILLCLIPIYQMADIYTNEITIRTNKIGAQYIIHPWYVPNEIYINETKVDENKIYVYVPDKFINIRMVWFNRFTYCTYMFKELYHIKYIDLSKFDSSSITNVVSMFLCLYYIESLDLSNFNTSSVTNMESMFSYCNNLKYLDLSNFDTSKVTDMSFLFYECQKLESLNLSHFDTSNVTNIASMFFRCYNLKFLDISNFNTSKVTDMSSIFTGCSSLKSLDLSHFDTKKVTDMHSFFCGCNNLESINLSHFDTSKVTDMKNFFYECYSLESINVSSFNTSSVSDITYMFRGCYKLNHLDVSNFDTSRVIRMSGLFRECRNLTSVDISSFNTSLVKSMGEMFYGCIRLKFLNLSHFDTSEVEDMSWMFWNCSSIEILNLSNFYTPKLKNIDHMFQACLNLQYLNLKNLIFNGRIKYGFDYIPENLVFCVNETIAPYLYLTLKSIKCSTEFCLDDNWKAKQKRIFKENDKFICEIPTSVAIYKTNLIDTTNKDENGENIEINISSNINTIIYEKMDSVTFKIQENSALRDSLRIKDNIENYFNTENIKSNIFPNDKDLSEIISETNNENNIIENTYIDYNSNSELVLFSENINDTYDILKTSIYSYDHTNTNIYSIETSHIITYETDFLEIEGLECILNNKYINETLSLNDLSRFLYDYFNENTNNKLAINHYISNYMNFSIFVFQSSYCTKLLFKYGYFEINTDLISDQIKKYFNINEYIFIYINKNYNNYIEIYELNKKNKININVICPECFSKNNLIIINNFTNEIYTELGKSITDKILENDIDPFNENTEIFNNICKNFTIYGIDIPIKERRKLIFLGYKEKEIVCNDINCDIEEKYFYNFTGICKCKISTNFSYLISIEYNESNQMSYEEYQNFVNSKSTINSFLIFKCGKEAFMLNNIKINPGFYISIIFLIIYIILYGFLFFLYFKGRHIIKSNPPKISKFEKEENNPKKSLIIFNGVESDKTNENVINKNIFMENNEMNNKFVKDKKRSIKNIKHLPPIPKSLISNSQNILVKKEKEAINKEENINLNLKSPKSFKDYYWKYLSLEQPIINLLEPVKCLKIENSYIPITVKLMRVLIILSLNIFFNIFHLEQNYFRKKYEFFNDKFNIIYNVSNINISLNERIKFGFSHSFISALISFALCFIIKLLMNYFIFNIRKEINKIDDPKVIVYYSSMNQLIFNNNINSNIVFSNYRIFKIIEKQNKRYLFFFGIIFIILLLIYYTLITFNEIYRGGITDLVAGIIWTFVFLQIISFLYCFIPSFLKFRKIKNNKN